jgi:hypothetical protein
LRESFGQDISLFLAPFKITIILWMFVYKKAKASDESLAFYGENERKPKEKNNY